MIFDLEWWFGVACSVVLGLICMAVGYWRGYKGGWNDGRNSIWGRAKRKG